MANSTPLVPLAAVLMIAASLGAGWTGYIYNTDAKADAYYLTEASELRSSALQAIYLSERAATDSNLLPELEKLEASVESYFSRIQNGDPVAGIGPAPQSLQSQLATTRDSWDSISGDVAKIISSKSSTESFTRARQDTKKAMDAALADAEAGLLRLDQVAPNSTLKPALADGVSSLQEAAAIINRESVDTETIRAAESAISAFLGAVTSIGRSIPSDKALYDSLTKSYRGAQATQRLIVKLIDSTSGAINNLPHARLIWAERDRFGAASNTLVETAKSLPATHLVTAQIVGVLGGIAVLLSLITSIIAHRSASTRAQSVEARGNQIVGSQQERSRELSLLLSDINEFGRGQIGHHVADDKSSTKEIATVLNQVFVRVRAIIQESDQTVAGLAAATEQTLMTAKNVDRNRQEQLRALEHISVLITEMSSFVDLIQEMTGHTQKVAFEVSSKVRAGSDSVTDVHQGIQVLVEHNNGIQHRSKTMIESFQSLERVVQVVTAVADRSDLVAFNAHLVADQIEGNEEVAKAMNKTAEAITVLADQCKSAVTEIDVLLRNMNESARDTQHAVDSSQREIDGLLDRSRYAQQALSDISIISNSLNDSMNEVTGRTQSLRTQTSEVSSTMDTVLHYSSENAVASEQTAQAISNVNRSAQELQRVIVGFLKGKGE